MSDNKTPRVNTGKIIGQVDATQMPRYGGIATFAHLPQLSEVSDVDVAIVGVPFDTGVSYRPGARFGPNHVRESSRLLRPYNPAANVSPLATSLQIHLILKKQFLVFTEAMTNLQNALRES
jgi:agmatinase